MMSTDSPPVRRVPHFVASGTVVTLAFLSVILLGGIVAIWPRFTISSQVRRISRELPRQLRERYPDAKLIFVKTRACRFNHVADITLYFERPSAKISRDEQLEEIEAWLSGEFPRVFIQEFYITAHGGGIRGDRIHSQENRR